MPDAHSTMSLSENDTTSNTATPTFTGSERASRFCVDGGHSDCGSADYLMGLYIARPKRRSGGNCSVWGQGRELRGAYLGDLGERRRVIGPPAPWRAVHDAQCTEGMTMTASQGHPGVRDGVQLPDQRTAGELRPVPGVIEYQRAGQRERERAEAPAGRKLGHIGQRLRQTESAGQELAFLLHEDDDTDRGAQRLRR